MTNPLFARRHYSYLADTIINETSISEPLRADMFYQIGKWLHRDCQNFDAGKWASAWSKEYGQTIPTKIRTP